ncbi:2'-5' RNA ligase family protein [Methanofollis fontis]|uniref:2'-5' RNA ligase n=1 Tax=Methanofollis fontis TaxID=2052832 RepID=A0A483CSW4_9EURY|nr:2'-5' RNA ligase family protein [Methanofollis fontis]TAJ45434.1 hypothetical protein CUJ86_01485 [Methanofollis fontis]
MAPHRIIAVDLALLLPDGVAGETRRLNALISNRSGDRSILLGTQRCLPHITLAMAPLEQGRVSEAAEVLSSALERCAPLHLTISRISTVVTGAGHAVSGFDLEPAPPLLALHQEIVDGLEAIRAFEPPALCTGRGEESDAHMAGYVQHFLDHSARERYSPHITLGAGEAGDADTRFSLPHSFAVRRGAVCHVGRRGTCRQILAQTEI